MGKQIGVGGFPAIDDPAGDSGMQGVQEQFREPDGWKLVPTKHDGQAGLTHEMCAAFWAGYYRHIQRHGHFESTNAGYNAMLAVAPRAES